MRYEDIKDFTQRCEEHPAHQTGMITNSMIAERLGEEIDELREYIESQPKREWVGLTDEEIQKMKHLIDWTAHWSYGTFARAIEAKLKEKNGVSGS